MKRIVIAVLLSLLGPGLGQIYNREIKKGAWLLAVSFILFFLPLIWLMRQTAPLLGNAKEAASPERVQEAVMQAVAGGKHFLNIISFTFLGVWAYSITQAYFKAKELHEMEEPPEEDPEENP